ncbi:hypothetical protein BR63_00380 [Thermanaerosceptrum fracticalcis]|uniref:Uncharacterized protein n=1 Tax=Thermanaerosceptrum fracticalcis TaxID=1712410 RepID=A0A7G6DYL3_THEFR|nr:hypothetical protein [Thermanaerosceptrum fracticalcis]QNB44917.1 hypothetical protein BR63_00380 [Thermanaerosceptrum fracticalcis]
MRLIARFPNKEQVGFLVDSLRNSGFDRKDMIISDLGEEQEFKSIEDAAEEMPLIKTELESLSKVGTFGDSIKGLKGRDGIIVAVELPKHDATRVREMMEQSGAVEIIQD